MRVAETELPDRIAERTRRRSAPPSAAGYVILTCSYTPNSAGIGCLYRLCDELNRRGYRSFMTGGNITAPHLNAPLIDQESAQALCAGGYAAIYPETIAGNPLGARSVVRWVLNRPGLLGGDEVYEESELVFSYSDVFLPYIRNHVAGKLYMPTIDESLFYCDDADLSKRSLECFYVGKSTWKEGVVDRAVAFEITRETPAKKELGKLFRASRVLYSFDNSTILIYEALLCGCPVVVIPDGTQTKEDYQKLELGADGIAWGPEEFRGAPVDVAGLQARYDKTKRDFAAQLDHLIELSRPPDGTTMHDFPSGKDARNVWSRDSWLACRRTAKGILQRGRSVERAVRQWRKRCVRCLKELALTDRGGVHDDGSFYCTDSDLSKRSLECFYLGRSRWREGALDRSKVFEVAPDTSSAQLGKLLRASRMLYCFDAKSPLVQQALACGCPVTKISKSGLTVRLDAVSRLSGARPPSPAIETAESVR